MANCPATAKRCAHRCSALLTLTDVDVAKEIERAEQSERERSEFCIRVTFFWFFLKKLERERGQSAAGERAAK